MQHISKDQALKDNVIRLAQDHRRFHDINYPDGDCGISLHLLAMLMEQAGITLTEEEKKIFW